MVMFPDESHMERSKDGTEPIRGGSVGWNTIFGLFKNRAASDQTPFATLFLINLETVFRNNYNKALSHKEIFDACVQDMDLFLVYFEAYLSWVLRGKTSSPIPVVLYIPNYQAIPKDLLRSHPASWELMMSAYDVFRKKFPTTNTLSSQTQFTSRWVVPVGSTTYPHIELAHWVHNAALENQSGGYTWGDPVCLITRNVIDLHITRRIRSLLLLESYTAQIKTPDQFGSKLIKDVPIPFTVGTHRAFGDPVHIKPIVERKTKKELLELAVSHKWMTRSTDGILRDISSVTGVGIAELQRAKF